MQDYRNIKILSTRFFRDPNLYQYLQTYNIHVNVLPFINIQFLPKEQIKKEIDHIKNNKCEVIFTSINSINALFDLLNFVPDWDIYCISGATKDLAIKIFGADRIKETAENGKELSKKIINKLNRQREIIFFCGNMHREEIPDFLTYNKIEFKKIYLYETIYTPWKIEETYDAILFFSPSAVKSFFSLNTEVENKTIFFSIGDTTAKALEKYINNQIIISKFPDEKILVEDIIQYYY